MVFQLLAGIRSPLRCTRGFIYLRSLHIPLGRHHERIDAIRRKRSAYVSGDKGRLFLVFSHLVSRSVAERTYEADWPMASHTQRSRPAFIEMRCSISASSIEVQHHSSSKISKRNLRRSYGWIMSMRKRTLPRVAPRFSAMKSRGPSPIPVPPPVRTRGRLHHPKLLFVSIITFISASSLRCPRLVSHD